MANYKVLVVDDEKNIVQGLKVLIDWEQLGCSLVGDAGNGRDGLALIRRLEPDIVISDVRMPYLNGLEMVREAGAVDSSFILLSGHADFEYAKAGIALGVTDYVLKPVDEDALIAAVKKAVSRLQAKRQDKSIRGAYTHTQRIVKDYVLRDFVDSYLDSDEEAELQLGSLDIPISEGTYTPLSFELSGCVPAKDEVFHHILEETLRQQTGLDSIVFAYVANNYVAILITPPGLESPPMEILLEKARSILCQQADCDITIGIGGSCKHVYQIPRATRQALQSLTYKLVLGSGSVNRFAGSMDSSALTGAVPSELWATYRETVRRLDTCQVHSVIDAIFDSISLNSTISILGMQINTLNLLLVCISLLNDMAVSLNTLSLESVMDIKSIYSQRSADNLRLMAKATVQKLIVLAADSKPKEPSVIQRIKEYINSHIYDDLSLVSVARSFHFSTVYLSQLFKKETGELFTVYITNLKIEKAKELLADKNIMVYEVAARLGYKDSKYFSRLFEKKSGYRPTDYKKKMQFLT